MTLYSCASNRIHHRNGGRSGTMLREAMGNDVIDHYVRCAEWEQEDFDRVVTDYEVKRGFEQA